MTEPIIWGVDAEASGFAICDNMQNDAECREKRGPLTIGRLKWMDSCLIAMTSTWARPNYVYVEMPSGGAQRIRYQSLLRTMMAATWIVRSIQALVPTQCEIIEVAQATWHRALCNGVPIPADIRAARPKWADHDLQTVAALQARGFTCPVNWSEHQVDARGIVEYAIDVWRAEQKGQPQRRKT